MRNRWKQLNSWHKFWLMFAGVFLVSTLAVMAAAWPRPDPAVLADLDSPACAAWRAYPDGGFPDSYPEASAPCRALRLFVLGHGVQPRSVADYRGALVRKGVRTSVNFLAVWAGFFAAMYLVGWSTARASGWLLRKRAQRAARG